MRRAEKEEISMLAELYTEHFGEAKELLGDIGVYNKLFIKFFVNGFNVLFKSYHKRGDIFVCNYNNSMTGMMIGMDNKKNTAAFRWSFYIESAIQSATAVAKNANKISDGEMEMLNKKTKSMSDFSGIPTWSKKYCTGAYHLLVHDTNETSRSEDVCRQMFEYIFDYAKDYKAITLETYLESNAALYEQFGFKLVKAAESKDKTLTQYRMIKYLEK